MQIDQMRVYSMNMYIYSLNACLSLKGFDHVASHDRHLRERISLFKAAFRDTIDEQG